MYCNIKVLNISKYVIIDNYTIAILWLCSMSADILSQRNSRCVCVGGLLLTDNLLQIGWYIYGLYKLFWTFQNTSRCFYMLDA